MKRILVGGFAHESNSFSPMTAGAADFPVFRGQDLLRRRVDNDAMTGILDTLEAQGYRLVPTLFTHAVPNGLVDRDFYLRLKAEFLQMAREALSDGPIDAITLELHGSMTVADYGEAEGPFLEELRALLPEVPLFAALDMHATMTAKMHANCDGFVSFKCAPHTDQRETGIQAARMTIAALERGIRPRSAWVKVPILVAGEQSSTTVEPMLGLIGALRQCEEQPGILAASYLMGYPWCDNADSSAGVYVTAENQALADREALRLAELLWARRQEFRFQTETYPEKEALDAAFQAALSGAPLPIYLSDSGDNPTAGSTSDCTGLLRRIMEDPRTRLLKTPALYGGIYDPEATAACKGNVGRTLTLTFGGKFDRVTSSPITAAGQVMACLEDWRGSGPVALFRAGGVDVVLAGRHIGYTTPDLFTALGRPPQEAELVVCKLGYLTAKQATVSRRSIMALSRGSTNEDLASLPYTKTPRPIFPLDPDCPFTPRLIPQNRMPRSTAPHFFPQNP